MQINESLVIRNAIALGNFTAEELSQFVVAVNVARERLMHKVKSSLCVGDKVKYMSTKQKREVTGIVTKISQKYVIVDIGQTAKSELWKVPASSLTVI